MISVVPFCLKKYPQIERKSERKLSMQFNVGGILEIKRKFNIATIVILYRLGWLNKWWFG